MIRFFLSFVGSRESAFSSQWFWWFFKRIHFILNNRRENRGNQYPLILYNFIEWQPFSKKCNVSSFKDHQRYGLGLKITEIQSFEGCIHLLHWFQYSEQFFFIDNLINYSSNWLQFGQLFIQHHIIVIIWCLCLQRKLHFWFDEVEMKFRAWRNEMFHLNITFSIIL